MNAGAIARHLQRDNVPGVSGKPKWAQSTVIGILQNEKYTGDALLQKQYTVDYLTGKTAKNEGQVEQIWVKDNHEPIIDKEFWQAAQFEVKRQKDYMANHHVGSMGLNADIQPFSTKVFCEECGKVFCRRTWTRHRRKIVVWQCASRYAEKGVKGCYSQNLFEKDLYAVFVKAWNITVNTRDMRLPRWAERLKNGDVLEKLRVQQMMELTERGLLSSVDPALVCKVLDCAKFCRGGKLELRFLDGTEVGVEI